MGLRIETYRPGVEIPQRAGDIRGNLDIFAELGPAYVISNGAPLAAMGMVVMPNPDHAEVWAAVSDDVRGHGLEFTRLVRRLLESTRRSYGVKMVHTTVYADSDEYRRWAECIGFRRERILDTEHPPVVHYVYRG